MKTVVSVQYQSKKDPEGFSAREYTYYSVVELTEGDVIMVPVKNGSSIAKVCRTDMSDSDISDSVRPYMRTIEQLVRADKLPEVIAND